MIVALFGCLPPAADPDAGRDPWELIFNGAITAMCTWAAAAVYHALGGASRSFTAIGLRDAPWCPLLAAAAVFWALNTMLMGWPCAGQETSSPVDFLKSDALRLLPNQIIYGLRGPGPGHHLRAERLLRGHRTPSAIPVIVGSVAESLRGLFAVLSLHRRARGGLVFQRQEHRAPGGLRPQPGGAGHPPGEARALPGRPRGEGGAIRRPYRQADCGFPSTRSTACATPPSCTTWEGPPSPARSSCRPGLERGRVREDQGAPAGGGFPAGGGRVPGGYGRGGAPPPRVLRRRRIHRPSLGRHHTPDRPHHRRRRRLRLHAPRPALAGGQGAREGRGRVAGEQRQAVRPGDRGELPRRPGARYGGREAVPAAAASRRPRPRERGRAEETPCPRAGADAQARRSCCGERREVRERLEREATAGSGRRGAAAAPPGGTGASAPGGGRRRGARCRGGPPDGGGVRHERERIKAAAAISPSRCSWWCWESVIPFVKWGDLDPARTLGLVAHPGLLRDLEDHSSPGAGRCGWAWRPPCAS